MYIKNRRNSSKIKAFGRIELSTLQKVKCPVIRSLNEMVATNTTTA
jgi:hypothetical protein